MNKDTTKIIEELKLCEEFNTFYNENKENMVNSTLSQMLNDLLENKKLNKSDIIKACEVSEVYAYQIFSGLRIPERKKLICIAIAMQLSLEEIQVLLKSAGYPLLYVKIPFDSIVMYGICKKMSIAQINELLFSYELSTLG